MRNVVVYDDWHRQAMNRRNDKSVNPVPVDYMDVTFGPLGTDFWYKANNEEGGALFSPVADIPIPPWARFFGANRLVQYLSPFSLAQDEFDWKFTLTAGQINQSLQINWKNKGGMWQWDPNDPPSWVDTGFNVAFIDPKATNDFQSRCSTDFSTWTLDKLSCNGSTFTPALVKVPLKQGTGWAPQMAHAQEQAQVTQVPAYTGKRYIRTQLIMSDGPIPLGWW